MSQACDELLLAVLRSEGYELGGIDDCGRLLFRSRSPSFVFYVDVLCLGADPADFQVFAYSLVEFAYGAHLQNRGKLSRGS